MMIDGIPAPGPSIFTKRTLLDDSAKVQPSQISGLVWISYV